MLDDFKSSIPKILYEKIISPFSGTFFFAWFIWNWRMLYYLLFSDDSKLKDKLDFVNSAFINLNHNLWYPLISTFFLVLIYPLITTGSFYIWLRYKKWQGDLRNEIEGKQLLTLEQSIRLRQDYKDLTDTFAHISLGKDEELKTKQAEMEFLSKKLDEEKRARETLAQSTLDKDEELQKNRFEIDKLKTLIKIKEEETPRISIKGQLHVENRPIEELLDSPLSADTLQEYTINRFRGLDVSTKLQSAILKNIDIANYPTLRNIDNAVNRAIPALVAYQLESPDMFECGTDYISKALGFVDDNFRAAHGFSNRTMAAFTRYGSLVKQSNDR